MGSSNLGDHSQHLVVRVLIVEDNPRDAELMVAVLKRAGFALTFEIVDEPALYEQALRRADYDVILCDHNLRTWNGLEALEILQNSGKRIPFLVVTATLGDEAAVDYIKQGAADYVLKGRMERLPVAIRQALRDRAYREEAATLHEQVIADKREWELTFDTVRDPILILDSQWRVRRANRAAAEIASQKFSEIIGRECREVIGCGKESEAECPYHQTLRTGQPASHDVISERLGGWFNCLSNPLVGNDGALHGSVIVLHDITERKRVQEILRDREERLRLLLDSTAEGIYGLDLEGRCTFCNAATLRILGYNRPEELIGKSMHALIHSPNPDGSEYPVEDCPIYTAFRQSTESHCTDEVFWRSDGTSIPVEYWSYPIRREGLVLGSVVTFTDITERKRAEESVRQLAGQLLRIQDNERRRIARELHDSSGQLLAALAIDLDQVRGSPRLNPCEADLLANGKKVLEELIEDLRTLSHLLHPPLLDDVGLPSALQWYVEEFEKRTGIITGLELAPDLGRLPADSEITIFRIVQEALANVHRHSGSAKAAVRLTRSPGEVRLEIADQGRGIPFEERRCFAAGGGMGIGLRGMRERVAQLGGTMEIRSSDGGTVVSAILPAKRESAAPAA